MNFSELKQFLDEKVELYNTPTFIESDPISIPHQFDLKEDMDIEELGEENEIEKMGEEEKEEEYRKKEDKDDQIKTAVEIQEKTRHLEPKTVQHAGRFPREYHCVAPYYRIIRG